MSVKTEITIRIRDIVIEVRDRIVIKERRVEVPVGLIVNEVFVIHRDKKVDLEAIIAEVERRVKASIPVQNIVHVNLPILVAGVSQSVIQSTPYVETGEVEHRVSEPKRKRVSTPQVNPTPVENENVQPVTPEIDDGGYVVYSEMVNGSMQSGVIHSDYVHIADGKITFTGQDGEVDAGDTVTEYVKIETGLTYEEASERAPEILTE